MQTKSLKTLMAVAAMALSMSFPVGAWGQAAAQHGKTAAASNITSAAPTDQQIADAKAKGLVWGNRNSKVYHKSDYSRYGKTKNGQFMTEADAIKGGYRLAKPSAVGKKKAPGSPTSQQ